MSAPRMFLLWVRHSFRAASLLVFLVLFTSCGDAHDVSQRKPEIGAVAMARVSERLAVCAQCHEKIVDAYLGHGMAHSLGVVETLPEGRVVNPESGDEYVYLEDDQKNLMRHVKPDGGVRTQQVMGRYGAGVLDMSFIGSELDRDGKPVSRMSFLPLEQLRGHGLGCLPLKLRRREPVSTCRLPPNVSRVTRRKMFLASPGQLVIRMASVCGQEMTWVPMLLTI